MKLKRPSSAPAHREQKHQLITTLNLDLRGPSPSSARNQLDPISNSDHFPSRQPPFPVVSGRHKSVKMDHRSVSNGKLLLGASSSILRCDGPDVTKEKKCLNELCKFSTRSGFNFAISRRNAVPPSAGSSVDSWEALIGYCFRVVLEEVWLIFLAIT